MEGEANALATDRTDYVLTQDKSFKKYAKAYAQDQDLWFKESVHSLLLPVLELIYISNLCEQLLRSRLPPLRARRPNSAVRRLGAVAPAHRR